MRVLASCDSKYFLAFGRTFYTSAKMNGYSPIINVINPTEEAKQLANGIKNIFFTEEKNTRYEFYASHRFIIAPKYIKNGLLIVDIDSIFVNSMQEDFIDYPVGIFKRTGGVPAAGLVWFNGSENSLSFAKRLSNSLKTKLKNPQEWGIDQTILNRVFQEYRNEIEIYSFDEKHFDPFKFSSLDTPIWSGKGKRKYIDKKYLNLFNEIKNNAEELFGPITKTEEDSIEATKDAINWHSPNAWLPRHMVKK